VVLGNEFVVIEGAAATAIESDFVVDAPAPSVSRIVKLGALAVGVPLITPVAGAIPSPAGNEPADTAQV
jgi:hypothetical protein